MRESRGRFRKVEGINPWGGCWKLPAAITVRLVAERLMPFSFLSDITDYVIMEFEMAVAILSS